HGLGAWCEGATGPAVGIARADVLDASDAVKTVDPITGEAGGVEVDVLRLWRRQGIGGHRIAAFAGVGPADDELVRTGTWLFGGLFIGLQLPLRAREQLVWDWTGSLQGQDAPGSWGGHAVNV